jgi:ABC-2 type transport system ATP-binding protein
MSTHSLWVAEEISDRIGIVDEGRLRFLGTLAELRSQLAQEHRSLEDLYLEITSRAGDIAAAAETTASTMTPPSAVGM